MGYTNGLLYNILSQDSIITIYYYTRYYTRLQLLCKIIDFEYALLNMITNHYHNDYFLLQMLFWLCTCIYMSKKVGYIMSIILNIMGIVIDNLVDLILSTL